MGTRNITSMLLITIGLLCTLGTAAANVLYAGEDPKKEEKVNGDKTAKGEGSSYTTSIGFRGGFTSGFSAKHFIGSNRALEGIIGSSAIYRGLSLTGLFELHKENAFGVPNLTWEYGGGGRIGFYNSYYYNRNWNSRNETMMAIGVVGLFGMEYKFEEVPFTVSVDAMPFIDFIGWGSHFIDGSASIRYILK